MSQPPDNIVHLDALVGTRQHRRAQTARHDTATARVSTSELASLPDCSRYRIGDWTIVPAAGEMHRRGLVVRLEPKVMDVLAALAEKPLEVVGRVELLDRVWGQRSVVSDDCLTRAVSMLRKAFADSARNPRYVQTLHKRGYRLIERVVLTEIDPFDSAPPTRLEPSETNAPACADWARGAPAEIRPELGSVQRTKFWEAICRSLRQILSDAGGLLRNALL
jgi:DNA-binding winged helix-turn-helix (wHTH) protein